MFAFNPGEVIRWIERRQTLAKRAGIVVLQRIDARKEEHGAGGAGHRLPKTRIAEIEDVDQVRLDDPGVLRRNALAVIPQSGCRRLAGKLRQDNVVGIVRQGPANAQGMLALGIDMVVDLGDDRAVVAMTRGVEAESGEVQSTVLSIRWRVARRKLIQDFQDAGIYALVKRIERLDLSRCER